MVKKNEIWKDIWVPTIDHPLDSRLASSNMKIVDKLMHPNSNRWNLEVLSTLFDSNIVNDICKITIHVNGEDILIWKPAENDIFTVKSVYKVIDVAGNSTSSLDDPVIFPWVKFWNLPLPPKKLHFLWNCVHGCLPVGHRIARHIAGADTDCPLCNKETETSDHPFLECEVANQVLCDMGYPLYRVSLVLVLIDWITCWLSNGTSNNLAINQNVMITITHILWKIWKMSCVVVFDNVTLQVSKIVQLTKKTVQD